MNEVVFPKYLYSIGPSAFRNCEGLEEIKLPDLTLVTIGADAFYGCGLKGVTIPDSVRNLGGSAFFGCPLSYAVIGDRVAPLLNYTFANTSFNKIYIPPTVTKIQNGAFGDRISNDFTVVGEAGSDAERFAAAKGCRFEEGYQSDALTPVTDVRINGVKKPVAGNYAVDILKTLSFPKPTITTHILRLTASAGFMPTTYSPR